MVGSFVHHEFIDALIKREKKKKPNCRQVVAVLLLCPAGHSICLTVSEKAQLDHRPRVSPPQGGIGETAETRHESLFEAAAREVREEVLAEISEDSIYLGSTWRELEETHPKFPYFRFQHYHWVAAKAVGWNLNPQTPTAEARWAHHTSIASSMQLCMSTEKRDMFRPAYEAMTRLSRDQVVVRTEQLRKGLPLSPQAA